MSDMTITATKLIRPLDSGQSSRPVRDSGGQNAPANGTVLPVREPARASIPELPELERLAESISRFVESINRDLSFRVDEASGHTVVTVIDGQTKEVIRQIPSEEFLKMAQVLASNSALLIDTEV